MIGGLLLVSTIFYLVHADSPCEDPIYSGELRPASNVQWCLTPSGQDKMTIGKTECLGYSDYLYVYCKDHTLRSSKYNTCLTYIGSQFAELLDCDAANPNQQFAVVDGGIAIDPFGVNQTKLGFQLKGSDLCFWGPVESCCLHLSWSLKFELCDYSSDMNYFFFRNKGKLIYQGNLRNLYDPSKCVWALGDPSNDKKVYLEVGNCNTNTNYDWWMYETGEIVNHGNGVCMQPKKDGSKGQYLMTEACDYNPTTQWSMPEEYHNPPYWQFQNQYSLNCFYWDATHHKHVYLQMDRCQNSEYFWFEWAQPPATETHDEL